MRYMTVSEASEKWGVSPRQVQRLLAGGKIKSAEKYGRSWMIPQNTKKPEDARRVKKPPQSGLWAELERVIAVTCAPFPARAPDAILIDAEAGKGRLLYEAELAYLRGDFFRALACFFKAEKDEALRLRIGPVAVASAISAGDYRAYMGIESSLKLCKNEQDPAAAFVELAFAAASISCMAPDMAPSWIKEGEFLLFPVQFRPYVLYLRAKYLQSVNRFEAMLAVAESALTLSERENGFTTTDIYLYLCCAAACHALERAEKGRQYLSEAMRMALPHGFITPFAENVTSLGGMMERQLTEEFPALYDAVLGQWKRTFQNWVAFHNQFTKDNLTLVLTLKEYHIAQMVARRVPYAKIAQQQCISVGRVKNIMLEVYGKLFISGREELSKYVF